jgi:hypothetical protein
MNRLNHITIRSYPALIVAVTILSCTLGNSASAADSWWGYQTTVPAGINPDDIHVTFAGTGGTIANIAVVPAGAIAGNGTNTVEVTWGAALAPGTPVAFIFSTQFDNITVAGGEWTVGGAGVLAIDPGDENMFCGGCYVYGYWEAEGSPTVGNWLCNYEDCAPGQCGPIQAATSIHIDNVTNIVTVTLGNAEVLENRKHVFIRVEGTGATDEPGNHNLDPLAAYSFETAPPVGGDWYVEVEATITPQPDEVVLTFEVPGTPALVRAWAGECCTPIGPIPTVSEWGLIVLTLLLLTAGTVVFGRRRRTLAA